MSANQSIYEYKQIQCQIQSILDTSIDQETGEIVDREKLNQIKQLSIVQEDLIKAIREFYKKMEYEIKYCTDERKRLLDYKKALEFNQEVIEDFILKSVDHISNKTLGIGFRHNNNSLVINEDVFKLPEDKKETEGYFRVTKKYEYDKTAIKNALMNGEKIDGCELVEKDTVSFGGNNG